jgi:hypothetical protein
MRVRLKESPAATRVFLSFISAYGFQLNLAPAVQAPPETRRYRMPIVANDLTWQCAPTFTIVPLRSTIFYFTAAACIARVMHKPSGVSKNHDFLVGNIAAACPSGLLPVNRASSLRARRCPLPPGEGADGG